MNSVTIAPKKISMKHTLISLGLLLTVAACSSDDDSDSLAAGAEPSTDTVAFSVSADSAQEIPATGSEASGLGTLTLDQTTGELSGSVTTTGIIINAAHIHEGFAGTNGGIIIELDVDGATITVPDSTVLTGDQQASMQTGGYYLNIHSETYPAGEIRAQLAPAGISVVLAALDGSNEVPAVTTTATGTAYLTVDETSGASVINVITTGLISPIAAHIHGGFAGSNGGILQGFEQNANVVGDFSSSAGAVLSPADLVSFQSGGTYINVHSDENPAGELRGQVLPAGVTLLRATLSGEQEVPPVSTLASGNAVLTLNENESTVTAFVNVQGAPTSNAGHIHEAVVGVNGPVIIGLTQSADDAGIYSVLAETVTSAQITTLRQGGLYFNVHTPNNPAGEIRGQIQP